VQFELKLALATASQHPKLSRSIQEVLLLEIRDRFQLGWTYSHVNDIVEHSC
jgi:hypothetical protein